MKIALESLRDFMKNKPHKLWVLFLTTLYISAFTFGGGFVIVTFMKHKFVDELHWINEQEMLDFTALAQSCPGAIAVNAAILVGWNVYGLAGMLVATLGTILPPMIILSVVSFFYAIFSANVWVAIVLKGMQAGVAAVILDAACSLGESVLKGKSSLSIFIMTAAFVCDFFLGVNVVYIILVAACIGIIQFIWYQYKPFFLKRTQEKTQKQKCLQETKL